MTEFITKDELADLDKTFLTITIKRSDRNSDKLVYMTDEGGIALRITVNDVPALKNDFSYAFSYLIDRLMDGLNSNDLSSALLNPYHGLTITGHGSLNRIFGPNGLDYLKRKFRLISDTGRSNVIIINTDVVNIPWECMYMESPLDLDESLSSQDIIGKFWGMRFVLARRELPTVSSHGPRNDPKGVEYLQKPVTIGVAISDSLPFSDLERDFFETMGGDPNDGIDGILVTEFTHGSNFIQSFSDFLHRDDLHLLHIACHAGVTPESPFDSYLEFSEEQVFLVRHLDLNPHPIKAGLIFLNACSTGSGNPLRTIDFVHTFQRFKNIENIIATEAMVDSQVAEQFAITFYDNIFKGKYLGESLYIARKSALESAEAKNVVSLFYSLHGNPFFHLKD